MTTTALRDLQTTLAEIAELSWLADFDRLPADDLTADDLSVERRDVVGITSDFATMGGSRPRAAQ